MVASHIRMPVFAYIAVVAPVLLGLLYAAEAMMGPPGAMPLSSEAPVLAKRETARTDSVQILTVSAPVAVPASALAWNETIRAPEPQKQAAAVPAEQAAPAQPVAATDGRSVSDARATEEPRKRVAAVKKKKPAKIVRERHDVYAYEPRQRSFFSTW